ncbi:uncharacterized protein [Musca autumnalis]|uniref:uncharacterized protein n=1 Tax=Musca autumnalis TaxID=221902 RepID=UPI003CF31942
MNIFTFIIIITLLGVGLCYQSVGVFGDPAHPDKCVYKNLVLSPGEKVQPKGECLQFTCNDSTGFGTIIGCSVKAVTEPCKLGDYVDHEGPYPDCCEQKIECP